MMTTTLRTLAIQRLATHRAPLATRSFSTTLLRSAGKESALHEDNDKRKRDIENLKQDHLHKVKNDKNHWEEGLASDSESNIAADKQAGDKTIEQLQKETEQVAKEKHGQ